MDHDGIAYKGFKWGKVGDWTEAPDFDPSPRCGGGLHGQGPGGYGCTRPGTRFCFCETGEKTISLGDKVKTDRAKIIAVDTEAFRLLIKKTGGFFKGSLDLSEYRHPLPDSFTHYGDGPLDLSEYGFPLPASFIGCSGDLTLSGYQHPLPAGFTWCGGDLNLKGYKHRLPEGFEGCGGDLYLRDYAHPLPASFTQCGGGLELGDYQHKLPKGFIYE